MAPLEAVEVAEVTNGNLSKKVFLYTGPEEKNIVFIPT
ncbi:hypothetical protein LEP1GSC195_3783 [Leptospira wolbachii serovar Codice str. CDC]|uniref:Uncharacterized protein n=1 Tax=Leptospira wolbachii serovar Codice str. CDC TaxID=1218599 RepID=R9A5K2_9LEPT|nr:hypothetical protein LEP1GSC195_3783 [Leptospira wolbachii serovar Codice str. CDC]